MEDISKIYQTEPISPDKSALGFFDKKKNKKRKPGQEAKKYFKRLTAIVDETHQELEESNSPFRICVYQEEDDVFIDIVAIDDTGKISKVFKHDISHDELEELIHHIKTGRGLLLDSDA